jgi:hypothetical protein
MLGVADAPHSFGSACPHDFLSIFAPRATTRDGLAAGKAGKLDAGKLARHFDERQKQAKPGHFLCWEYADVDRLARWLDTGLDRRPGAARAFLVQALKNNGFVLVEYRYSAAGFGRLWACGPSLQKLTREARGAAVGERCLDVDLVNAFPSLLDELTGRRHEALHAYVVRREESAVPLV